MAPRTLFPAKAEPAVLETLAELVDASLVVPDEAEPTARFSMLETVRVYAVERLQALPDRSETQRRHADWILWVTEDLLRTHGSDYRRASQRVRRERANLRTAARWLLDSGDVAGLALLVRNATGHLALQDPEFAAYGWLDEALKRVNPADLRSVATCSSCAPPSASSAGSSPG